jgi:thiamine monophosphate synthase
VVNSSYISLGSVFGTSSKKVAFNLQGLATVAKRRQLIPLYVLVLAMIGGIGDAETAT